MMTDTELCSDTQLVNRCLVGDRDAFGRIVERYQGLICALAYNACGDIGRSEDLAQETFLAAWRNLNSLKDRDRVKQWLCGIARHLIQESYRRATRDPMAASAPLEEAAVDGRKSLQPSEQMISKEERAILWRVLEGLPATYREPLILFYRQNQSVAEVAEALELSDDAVKQRLSRGRAILSDRTAKFVETALRSSGPGKAFTLGVLAALPLMTTSAKAATAGAAAAKGTSAVKSGFLGACLAPFIGIIGGMTASWLSIRLAPTERERRVKRLSWIALWVFALGWCFIAQPTVKALGKYYQWSDRTLVGTLAGFWWFYAAMAALGIVVAFRRILAIRQQFEAAGGIPQVHAMPLTGRNRLALAASIHLGCFSWLIYLAWHAGDRVWAGIIAVTMILLGAWYLYRLRGKNGTAAWRALGAHSAVVWGVILLVLNLRLDVWLAARREVSLSEFHQLLPMWVIPSLTLTLLIWIGLLLAVTQPKRRL